MEIAVESKCGVILVGHGGLPADCPQDLVSRLKRLEGERRAKNSPPTDEEIELDRKIRHWPRTPATDPYQEGLKTLAQSLNPWLNGMELDIAFNEFCAPSLPEAAESQIQRGIQDITVVSTMLTPGGSHSEIEIPEEVEAIRSSHPQVRVQYAWPFELDQVAMMLAGQIRRFQGKSG